MKRQRRDRSVRTGISMLEALVAIAVTAIAGGALLTSLGAAIQTSTNAAEAVVARGLAEQLMDEIASARFPNDLDVRPIDSTRINCNDLDDYDGWSSRPPVDRSGIPLGRDGRIVAGVRLLRRDVLRSDPSALSNFTREARVENVEPDGSGGWTTTNTETNSRRITVRVWYTDGRGNTKTVSELVQIVSNVPVSP